MHILINAVKVIWGLTIVSVCVVGLIVITKTDNQKERRNERAKRGYLYYSGKRRSNNIKHYYYSN